MFTALRHAPRLLIEVPLQPVHGDGHRFQPTGFPHIGAAVYERPDGKRMLLVESAQSVANRLEAICTEGCSAWLIPELEGIPYVLVKLAGAADLETSSLVEAHRLNSPFIITNNDFHARFQGKSGYAKGTRLDWPKIAQAVFFFDPNCLLHGVFMANLEDGRIKMPRAVTGFIEAEGVREAASGGVKNSFFDPSGKIRAVAYDKNVYGNVPFDRTEYVAERITAYFNVDLALLRGYGLAEAAQTLLAALALYKIRRFLSAGLRLRTACDFRAGEPTVTEPTGFTLPEEAELLTAVQGRIQACTQKGLFAQPPVTTLKMDTVKKEEKAGPQDGVGDPTSSESADA